jgi:hypothetical protein
MKRRRGAFIAIAVLAAGLVILNLGAHENEVGSEPTEETCQTDLDAVYDWCESGEHFPCRNAADRHAEACHAGCVMALCPKQVTCADFEPELCERSCGDWKSALHYYHGYGAAFHCDDMLDEFEDNILSREEFDAWQGCRRAYMKEHCPEFKEWALGRQFYENEDEDETE